MIDYRKRPVVVQARQWNGTLADATRIINWVLDADGVARYSTLGGNARLAIETLEGTMHAAPHDWIIRGVQGEFYPCKPDIFNETYEAAMTDEPTMEVPAHPELPEPLQTLVSNTTYGGALYVNVDWLDLLEHHDGDEAKAFETLTKLKDLMA